MKKKHLEVDKRSQGDPLRAQELSRRQMTKVAFPSPAGTVKGPESETLSLPKSWSQPRGREARTVIGPMAYIEHARRDPVQSIGGSGVKMASSVMSPSGQAALLSPVVGQVGL